MKSGREVFEHYKNWYREYTSADFSAVEVQAKSLVRLSDDGEENPDSLHGKKVCLFCGIGIPEGFRHLVATLGIVMIGEIVYPDHHTYRGQDLENLKNLFRKEDADCFLTTMKDAARLSGSNKGRVFMNEFPVYGLAINIDFVFGKETFHQHLDRLFT